jgi:pyruvate,water dikinase
MHTLRLAEIRGDDVERVGGKAASLGELDGAGLPVPPAFVVTAETYRSFIETTGIDTALFEAVDVDSDDSQALAAAAERAQELIQGAAVPPAVREDVLDAYDELAEAGPGGDPDVAVRSSATAEDLPDASFAGQQDTYLNVSRADLLARVKDCWASLFTQRAIYYRNEQGFDHADVDIAVVVQEMVDAEKSGVLFTSHPSTGDPTAIVEAAWGLGEAVVSGAVSPDNYVIDRETGEVDEVTVAEKRVMCVRGDDGETIERSVPEDKRERRVLSAAELSRLVELGERVETHYGSPQDVEWAIRDGELYLLQSRPLTTIDEPSGAEAGTSGATADGGELESQADDIRLRGIGSSPGSATGEVSVVRQLDNLDKVSEGDIVVVEMTTPDMVPAMQRAAGIVTDQGGMTSHAAIVSRELGVPAVVGTDDATERLRDGQVVRIDGEMGVVEVGADEDPDQGTAEESGDSSRPATEETTEDGPELDQHSPVKPMTGTEVKVNISIPEAAERAAATGADGVGLLRLEHMVTATDKTPTRYVADHGERAFVQEIVEGVRQVAEAFYPRPVRVRTLDAPSDEFRQLQGGEDEPTEHNPMLGYRGIRRSLDRPEEFDLELRAFARLYELGYDNVELMLPLVTDAEDVLRAKSRIEAAGIDPDKRDWGVMVETPASALSIEAICGTGIDFVSFGTNDLTQYTLAVDRNNTRVADRFDELHPAVLDLIADVIDTCRENDVATSICGQAASKPEMVQFLVDEGVTSISANIDAVRDVQHEVKRVEQRLLLDSVR